MVYILYIIYNVIMVNLTNSVRYASDAELSVILVMVFIVGK